MPETAPEKVPETAPGLGLTLSPGLVVLRYPHRESGDSKRRPCVIISSPGRRQGHPSQRRGGDQCFGPRAWRSRALGVIRNRCPKSRLKLARLR